VTFDPRNMQIIVTAELKANNNASGLILASASPRRREILCRLGVPFEVETARGVDEEAVRGEGRTVAMRLSTMKAESVREAISRRETDSKPIVLGGDTVVALGEDPGDVLGKPADPDHAREMLRRLSGRAHTVWTGVTVIPERGDALVEVEATRVVFRSLSEAEIETYIATGDFEGKAGAYGIQGAAVSLIEGFHGCYWNVVGLPLERTARLLSACGLVVRRGCECPSHPLQRGGTGCGRPIPCLPRRREP